MSLGVLVCLSLKCLHNATRGVTISSLNCKNYDTSLNFRHYVTRRIYHIKFPLAPMGVLVPGSAHARPSTQPPIDTSGNIPAHMSAESPSNISPNPQKSYPKFRNPRTTFGNTPLCPPNYSIVWGVRGVPDLKKLKS